MNFKCEYCDSEFERKPERCKNCGANKFRYVGLSGFRTMPRVGDTVVCLPGNGEPPVMSTTTMFLAGAIGLMALTKK